MEKTANERLRRNRRIIIAAAGLTVLLAAALIVGFVVVPTLTAGGITLNTLKPLLYTSDGTVYMASGGRTVLLEGAKIIQADSDSRRINAEFCADNNWLFYIANHNKTTGEGDLMRVASGGLNLPELVAQGVCDAKVSRDGQRMLYTSGKSADILYAYDMAWTEPRLLAQGVSWYTLSANGRRALYVRGDENTGDLYSWDFVAEPEFISGGVCAEYDSSLFSGYSYDNNCGFSPDANNIYYIVKTTGTKGGKDEYTLYVKISKREAEKVAKRGENNFLSGTMNGGGPLGDNGQMLYFSRGTDARPLYVFSPGGEIEHFIGGCMVWMVFGDGSFLFRSDNSLYYKAPGQQEQRLSECLYMFPLFGSTYYDLRPDAEKRFLFAENYADWDEALPESVTLFEQKIGGEKTELCEMDARPLPFTFDKGLTKVAYKLDGILYMMQKENGEWSKPEIVSDTGFVEIHIYQEIFDTAGEYMYYLQLETEDAKSGGLYRYTIKRHKGELLMQDVRNYGFYLIDDIPYAITSDGALFRADTGARLAQGVDNIWQAGGGIHILAQDGILYYGKDTDKPVTLCEDADTISAGGITYLPPLTSEVSRALEELCDDAQRCIDVLKAGGTGSFEQYQAKADALKARRDVSSEINSILDKFSMAFMQAGMWDAYAQTDIEGGKEASEYMRNTITESLSDAIKNCREYLGTQGDI